MKKILFTLIALLIFVADQLSKWAVSEHLIRPALGDPASLPLMQWLAHAPARLPFAQIPVFPFFNIVMVWNRGMSFGILNDQGALGPLILSALALIIVVFFTIWLWRGASTFQSAAIALVIGGALGNVMDRTRFGAVVDFLDFHAFQIHFPAFNVSDSAICVGIFLLILGSFFFENQGKSDT